MNGPDRRTGVAERRDLDAHDVTRAEHIELEDAITAFTRRSIWTLRAIAAIVVGIAIAVFVLADANGDRVTDLEAQADAIEQQADANAEQADAIGALVVAIERTRRQSIVTTCRDTNERHDNSLRALEHLADQAVEREPEREVDIRQGTRQFKVFVEALVPHRDCQKRADELTNVDELDASATPGP